MKAIDYKKMCDTLYDVYENGEVNAEEMDCISRAMEELFKLKQFIDVDDYNRVYNKQL